MERGRLELRRGGSQSTDGSIRARPGEGRGVWHRAFLERDRGVMKRIESMTGHGLEHRGS